MREIELTQNKVVMVDDGDYEYLNQFNWCSWKQVSSNVVKWYAVRHCRSERNHLYMHRVIMDAPRGMQVDHIDRNGLNNQRSNLRIVTSSQNLQNMVKTRGISKFKGIYKDKNRWAVNIQCDGERYRLFGFETEEQAARAYDELALKWHGEYARTNKALGLFS